MAAAVVAGTWDSGKPVPERGGELRYCEARPYGGCSRGVGDILKYVEGDRLQPRYSYYM